jgi:hypothetical protein
MPATKPNYDEEGVGTNAQINSVFLKQLWDPDNGSAFRSRLLNARDEKTLRDLLDANDIKIRPDTVRIVVFDVESAKVQIYRRPQDNPNEPPRIDTGNENFYVLVLPPSPKRHDNTGYRNMQRSAAAYYHAVNESYGM